MTPEELKAAAMTLWGERGWVAALASALEVDRTQVWRYVNAKSAVPGPVGAAVRCWMRRFVETGERPEPPISPDARAGDPPKPRASRSP